ncbi:ATP-binding protein [Leptospira ilyithenensis]|uniref:ATP-binding protein n=1 Tax=Leptospira ilyithenensis TaxID=2484901 RepID=A0A4R9LT59_9LEPT|nr:ATP-binding protein [Leptospira ilyithenensis]TGN14687.1 ATP-binding protein [Leptospira ilyithenensis]
MKISFSILTGLFSLGNLSVLLDSSLFQFQYLANPHTSPSFLIIFCFALLNFGLQFPTYFRNKPSLSLLVSFILGAGTMLLLIDWGLSNEMNPLASDIILNIFYPAFYAISFFAFASVISIKLQFSFPAISKFMYSACGSVILSFLFSIYLFSSDDYIPNLNHYYLQFLVFCDLCFLLCFVFFLIHFSFTPDYLTHPFSYLFETSKKIFEDYDNASSEGSRELKQNLWTLYEKRNWKSVMDSFWFQILVDETLDNALEHGGKRGDDKITVHVFESARYIDVYVIDRGKGFNPRLVPNPLNTDRKMVSTGRGIHILKKLFIVRWNFLGNEICIRIDKSKSENWKSFH